MDCSTTVFPVYHQLPELTQTHVHGVGDAFQPSDPLSSPSPPTFNLPQHQGLFKRVSSSHQVAKVLQLVIDREAWCAAIHGVAKSWTERLNWTELCDPMNCSTPGFPVHHQLPEFTQTHVHWVGDGTQSSHPLSSPPPTYNLSQYQGLFKWVSSSHQVAKGLELQLQHQSFQWTPRTDGLVGSPRSPGDSQESSPNKNKLVIK